MPSWNQGEEANLASQSRERAKRETRGEIRPIAIYCRETCLTPHSGGATGWAYMELSFEADPYDVRSLLERPPEDAPNNIQLVIRLRDTIF